MNIKELNIYLKQYAKPDLKKVGFQILNTLIPYICLITIVMFLASRGVNYFLLLPLSIGASCFMVRVFILFHDCTHKSFVRTRKWNTILGYIFGVLVFTPYISWQKDHNIHHGTVGNLDKRGVGDIWMLTVEEYKYASHLKRFVYRLFRHPIFLFVVAPLFLFAVLNRIPKLKASKSEVLNYIYTNFGIVVVGALLSFLFTFKVYIIYQITVLAVAATMGVWLFYIQHQYEEVYWEKTKSWEIVDAALKGSSFYKLPLVFEWISGYIGYHHIHHLNSKIPNYNLKASYKGIKSLKGIRTVTLMESFRLAFLQFYDVKEKRLISYKELQTILKKAG